MKISPNSPFQVVYALYNHEYLGYLFNAFIVELDGKGQLTLKSQRLSLKTAQDFKGGLGATDFEIIKIIDSIQQEAIIQKYHPKKISPHDFFFKNYHKEKGNAALQEAIGVYIDLQRSKLMPLLCDKPLFIMGKDGSPIWRAVQWVHTPATVYFHFKKQPDSGIVYYPTVYCQQEKLNIQGAMVICNQPACLIIQQNLYTFAKGVEGKKLEPFTRRFNIEIPAKNVESYYHKFVASLVANFDVKQDCFKVVTHQEKPQGILQFSEYLSESTNCIFDDKHPQSNQSYILFELYFRYHTFDYRAEDVAESNKNGINIKVEIEKQGEEFVFHKIYRKLGYEKQIGQFFQQNGIELKQGRAVVSKSKAFEWINTHRHNLQGQNISLKSNLQGKRYFLGQASISVAIKEHKDWFDILATISFGDYVIPFLKIRQLILQHKVEFELPNGEIALIPDTWLQQYSELFYFSEERQEKLQLRKHHLSIVQELKTADLAQVMMSRKLEKLQDFNEIEDFPLPQDFACELRPYQKAGYNWLCFLNKYNFGGCLADDMGLGKTATTLALLQAQKEAGIKQASLIIVPTSLIYNWEIESKKFAPKLKIFVYGGSNRLKNTSYFDYFDVVLTSYSIARIDIEVLKEYLFHYVILDESQAIKNPNSYISLAVAQLRSKHRLILTGTPLENSTLDLWSQMSFVNPGLLGTQSFFKKEFLQAIEKNADASKLQRLSALIKPFILRRLKSQVATELPDKVENIQYCLMTPEQERLYEQTKAAYRNQILSLMEKEQDWAKNRLFILQGLSKLRQIACHPCMVSEDYVGSSGKLEDIMHKIAEVISEGSKVLIFSQFVKHLQIVKQKIEEKNWQYAYLDGSTIDRQASVQMFQKDKQVPIFLISLKAGGVGLNLTEAEYVFMLDPWWNPAVEAQAIDRTHRIGQKNTVFAYKFITKNTVEEKILGLQKQKLQLAENLILTDENISKSLTSEDVLNLLN